MKKFETSVPFDPGYSKLSFSFIENISFLTQDYNQSKSPHQKKFKLNQLEPKILDLINKSAAFYLGCMLWGGTIMAYFKNNPKEITGNHTNKLDETQKKELDCADEVKFMLEYINFFDRDCKYFLNKPAKVSDLVIKILNSYIEFAKINNNFIDITKTDEIKLPQTLSHFEKLTKEQLENLCDKIMESINLGKIENLLELGFYN